VRLRAATWIILGAAVHRHSLVRLNAINDSIKKKEVFEMRSSQSVFFHLLGPWIGGVGEDKFSCASLIVAAWITRFLR